MKKHIEIFSKIPFVLVGPLNYSDGVLIASQCVDLSLVGFANLMYKQELKSFDHFPEFNSIESNSYAIDYNDRNCFLLLAWKFNHNLSITQFSKVQNNVATQLNRFIVNSISELKSFMHENLSEKREQIESQIFWKFSPVLFAISKMR